MTTDIQLRIADAIIATGLVSKVYHSCQQLRNDQNQRLYAAYKSGNEFLYAGIDDTKGMFAYIRNNGDINATQLKVASCSHSYDINAPLRVVFFSDHEEKDFNFLIERLSSFTFLDVVTLQRVIDDKWRLIREESDIFRERFDGKTFYVAFDVIANFVLLKNTCEQDACPTFPNPICKQ